MKQRSLIFLAPTMIAALALTAGCVNADTIDGPVEMTVYNIVTFEGNEPGATFSYCPPGTDTPLTLRSAAAVDTAQATPGSRVMLGYIPARETGGEITVKALGRVTMPALTGTRGVPRGWDADGVWVTSVWRSGQYVDMRLRLPYSTEARVFALAVDSTTLGSPVPKLYLCHTLPEGVTPETTFSRNYYVSACVSPVWNRPEVEGIEINIANTNLPSLRQFIFMKPED